MQLSRSLLQILRRVSVLLGPHFLPSIKTSQVVGVSAANRQPVRDNLIVDLGAYKQRDPIAEGFLRRAIRINGTDSDEYVYLGLTLWRQGRLDEAAEDLERAIQIRPSAPGYHYVMAMIRRDQNDIAAARAELNLELAYHPESTAARQQLAALDSNHK